MDISRMTTISISSGDVSDDFDDNDYLELVGYTPLETNSESLIGNIDQIIFPPELIVVLDNVANAVLIFDRNGRFVNRIGQNGNGPGELTDITSISYDYEDELLVVACSGKVLWFDKSGTFDHEVKSILGGAKEMTYVGDNLLASYAGYIQLDEDQNYHQLTLLRESDLSILQRAIPYDRMSRVENKTGLYVNFSENGTERYLTTPYQPYIWQIEKDGIFPLYKVDYGEDNLPSDFESKYLTSFAMNSDRLRQIEVDKGYARFRGGAALLSDNGVEFTYSQNGGFYKVMYHRKSTNLVQFKIPINNTLDEAGYIVNRGVMDNQMVSILTPDVVHAKFKRGDKLIEKLQEIREQVKEDDNPILRMVRYREF